jgi:hypothetical protein
MPLLHKGVQMLTDKAPKVISPRTHAIIDYAIVAGGFFVAGALAWRRHKRAAISAFICGAAETGVAMITDFPGGVTPLISFPTHLKIDAGLSAVTATMPNLMGFDDEGWPATFFRLHGTAMAAVGGSTQPEVGIARRTESEFRRVA